MRSKLKKFLTMLSGRVFITGLLLILQIYWFAAVLLQMTQYSTALNIIFQALSLLIVLLLVSGEDNPSYRIAWITLVMVLPLMGGLLYLMLGNKRPSKRMRARIETEHRRLAPSNRQDEATLACLEAADGRAAGRSRYLSAVGGYPLCGNSETTYYSIGEEMFDAMLEALESAEHFIFMEFFIIADGVMWRRILDILKRKAAAGVDVRFMYDDMGSLFRLPWNFAGQMEAMGIKCLRFNPFVPFLSLVMNNRDHRKIMVIDGHTAFNGGINLADEYINRRQVYGHWKDTGVCVRGEAVWSFTLMFLEMWYAFRKADGEDVDRFRPHVHHPADFESDGFVQPFADSPLDEEPLSETVYVDILAQAERYAYIFTPYLVIDDALRTALTNAAKRGVDVRIVTPGVPDKKIVFRLTRSNYPPLLRAGVRIYEYTPGFMHAKSIICDDLYGVVGTINLDYRSLFLHFECGTYLYGAHMLAQLRADAAATFEKSREITPEGCKQGFWGRLLDAVLRAFAPLC